MKVFYYFFLVCFCTYVDATPIKFIAQKAQDQWVIEDVFQYKEGGFFVDLAASDGVTKNNTYNLEKYLNWTGLCIEPNPIFFKELQRLRSVIVDPSVIDGVNHTVEFRYDNGVLGGIVDEDTDNSENVRGAQILFARQTGQVIQCDTVTLEQILDKYHAPKIIDYLSLDVEGAETRILRDFPFHKYTFLAMTIERPTSELNDLLFSNGYIFVKNLKYDSFYVHESIPNIKKIKKEPFSQIPIKDW